MKCQISRCQKMSRSPKDVNGEVAWLEGVRWPGVGGVRWHGVGGMR